ncbi:MAG: response regulator [Planctomycetes bacterium]|nr:response regulator [Planctomycetota bacterium]
MSSSPFRRRLNFGSAEYENVLSNLDRGMGPAKAGHERSHERFEYHVADLPLLIEHPEGGSSCFLVFGRNISRRGISVLHGGFVHPGSTCRVLLQRVDGTPLAAQGRVAHCRLVAGSCHEVGVRFIEEVDPMEFVRSAGPDGSTDDDEPTHYESINGRVIVAESFEADGLLLQHHLSLFRLEISAAKTPGAVLDTVKREQVDLVLFGLSLTADDGLRTITAIREAGCTAPVLVLTAETDPAVLDAACAAGATEIIAKPYNVDLLIAQLRAYLGKDEPRSARHSTAVAQPGMPPLIDHYVRLVQRTADQIERQYAESEWQPLREYCRQLKGSGCGFGFQDVTVAAITLLNALDDDPLSPEARESLESLLDCCRSLETTGPGRANGE